MRISRLYGQEMTLRRLRLSTNLSKMEKERFGDLRAESSRQRQRWGQSWWEGAWRSPGGGEQGVRLSVGGEVVGADRDTDQGGPGRSQ